nr:hypothetical protein [uncultured Pseudomonas sp.]
MENEFTLEWALDDAKRRIVESMCMTWRHDFGLDKPEGLPLSSGMAPGEREVLLQRMGQLYEHHIAALVRALEEQRRLLVTLESAALRLQDEEIDALRAKFDSLQIDADRYRGVRRVANAQGYSDEKFDSKTDQRIARFAATQPKGGHIDG